MIKLSYINIILYLNHILQVLQEIESRHGLSEFNINKFIGLLYNQPFPKLGSSIFIPQESENCYIEL